MDFKAALEAGGISASLIAILGVAYKVIQSFCGHRLRSECCGREATVGVNVEDMSPRIKRESIPTAPTAPAERAVCIDVEGKEVIKTEIKSV
jgi:hypothetical protein